MKHLAGSKRKTRLLNEGPREPMADTDGGEMLANFVTQQLQEEDERRTAIDRRGTAVISTSATVSTLLFGAAALVTAKETSPPPRLSLIGLAGMFVTFFIAALCGLMAIRTRGVDTVAPEQLETWRKDVTFWSSRKSAMLKLLTRANIRTLTTLRAGNNTKMAWARRGLRWQLGSLVPLALAVGAILFHALVPSVKAFGLLN
jgi:hypothetical protein